MLSVNVCSLMSKHHDLANFINSLIVHRSNILLVAIQESWEIPYDDLVSITGFNIVYKNRTLSKGGGVAFYINSKISYRILNHLSHFYERNFECLTVELNIGKKKIIASNIYKSPHPITGSNSEHNDLFISNLDTHLYNLAQNQLDSYVFLDSNVNLLNINSNNTTALYLETIYSNGFSQKIGKATRISGQSFSLIDHILCKTAVNNLSSGTILTDFSDHFTNFLVLPDCKPKPNEQFVYSRNLTPAKITEFKSILENLRWNSVLSIQDTNLAFDEFWSIFNALYNLHFPLKKCKLNRNVHKLRNFMTTGLLVSRKKKNDLHKLAIYNYNLYHEKYITYRNLYNKVIKASKQLYLDENFKKFQKNPKKTWDLLKETTFGKVTKNSNISEIIVNNNLITDKKEISNGFNDFFSNIGTSIKNSIPPISKKPEDYITDFNIEKTPLEFERINPAWIIDIVKSFENKTSPDLDGLSIKFVKQIIYYILTPLTHIFNLSFATGTFPEKFKESRIVPIFKSGDPKSCDNYRPISLVNSLSKILDKIEAIKLTNFYINTNTDFNEVYLPNTTCYM